MHKLIKAFCLTIALSICAAAQSSGNDYKRNEFYVGFSHQQVDIGNSEGFNGFEASYVRNFHRYFGIKGDVSGAYKNRNFSSPVAFPATGATPTVGFENNRSVYNFLGGIQVKNNATEARFKPFGHALIGAAVNRSKTKNITCLSNCTSFTLSTADFSFTDTGFAGAFGGGLDIKINEKIDFRVIQIDYNPIYSNSRVDNNIRFGAGIVFK
jgi:hypothetical protein